jgi:hypothetical protein
MTLVTKSLPLTGFHVHTLHKYEAILSITLIRIPLQDKGTRCLFIIRLFSQHGAFGGLDTLRPLSLCAPILGCARKVEHSHLDQKT